MVTHRLPVQDSGATTYSRHLPLVPVAARGVRIRDKSGRWLIDCLAGAGAASLGWGHPVVNEAIRSVIAADVPLSTLDLPTPQRDTFLHELLLSLPQELADDAVVHLCPPSGAIAVEAALAIAEASTGGTEHIAVEGGFHGCSRGARSISSDGGRRSPASRAGGQVHFLPFPQQYRCPFGVGGDQGTALAIRAAEHLLLDRNGVLDQPASVIVECLLGEGGCLPAPPEWLRTLRRCSSRAGIPLITDEVQTGMCRTGKMWSFEHAGVLPDILLLSKGLGGGVPIAAVVMRSRFNCWESGAFSGTFRGSALGFSAAAAVLRFARQHALPERVTKAGNRLLAGLRQVQDTSHCIADVRGWGLMLGAEVVEPEAAADHRGVRPPAAALTRRIQRLCYDRDLLVEVGGVHGNVIRFLPPLVIEEPDLDQVVEIFESAVQAAERAPASRALSHAS